MPTTTTPSATSTTSAAATISATTTTTAMTTTTNAGTADVDPVHYRRPGRFTRTVANRLVNRLIRSGVPLWGARQLRVRGRTSGEWRSVPVNLLTVDGRRYLVAPRGETQWVRNLRAAGGGELCIGRRCEQFTATELAASDKEPILRAYLKRWAFEVGVFFEGVDADSSPAELARIAPRHPVFRLD